MTPHGGYRTVRHSGPTARWNWSIPILTANVDLMASTADQLMASFLSTKKQRDKARQSYRECRLNRKNKKHGQGKTHAYLSLDKTCTRRPVDIQQRSLDPTPNHTISRRDRNPCHHPPPPPHRPSSPRRQERRRLGQPRQQLGRQRRKPLGWRGTPWSDVSLALSLIFAQE